MNTFGIFPKHVVLGVHALVICSCNTTHKNDVMIEKRINALEKKLNAAYRPGLGEFMSGISLEIKGFRVPEFEQMNKRFALKNSS